MRANLQCNDILQEVLHDGAPMDWPERAPEIVPHKRIYFPDGDVVLQSTAIPAAGDSVVFRIHVSILDSHSREFASKLRRTPGTSVYDEYDGVPLITLPDTPEELEGTYLPIVLSSATCPYRS